MAPRKVKHTAIDNPQYRIITVEEPLSIAAESYRRIKTSLEFANVDKKIQVIQICSSMQGEGKSVTALNVAATYAEDTITFFISTPASTKKVAKVCLNP